MSNRSSVLDESFIERKSRNSNITNTSGLINSSTTLNGGFSTGSLPVGEVSPFQSINPLVESPFQQSRFYPMQSERKVENRRNRDINGSFDDDNLLKRKVRAYQKRFQDAVQVETPLEIDSNTYLQSAFGSKRRIQDKKSLTGTSKSTATTKSTLNRDINDPYFTEALGRIVNKELELRKLLFSVLAFAVSRLVRSLVRLFVYTHPHLHNACDAVSAFIGSKLVNFPFGSTITELFTFENVLVEASYIDTTISAVLFFVMATSAYRLLKPQDKCLDLPLSTAQRKVLGLPVDEMENVGNDELDNEEEIVKRLHASPQRMEKPVQVVVPDIGSLDSVMGSLGGLDLRGATSTSTSTTSTSTTAAATGSIANVTPSGKYLYETRSELQGNRSFY
ncbi:hypothetical protein CANINC_004961 [Pichia inconspicua]|uniref:Uncharacterized protein n=1 Tax=Pichia inconspicua TaxID=52247 RepID=A0A4T0WUV7_9ASCO|nr:hypothetical protein CANINC_004961 [[Candida] inconspicua]